MVLGIYAFEGDQLKICLGSVKSGERPKTFGAKPKVWTGEFPYETPRGPDSRFLNLRPYLTDIAVRK